MEENKAPRRIDPLGWIRRHKKRAALIAAVILIAAVVLRVFVFKAAPAASYQFVRTTTLQKNSLTDSVSVNGTVKSGSEASVTVADSAKNYKVSEVRVTVGDKVQKGDVIAVLDTEDLQEQITSAEQSYSDSLQSAQTSYDRAVDELNTSTVQHENNLIDLQDKITQADEDLDDAEDDLDDAEDDLDDAEDDYDDAKSRYDTIKAAYDSAAASISTYTDAKDKAADTLNTAQTALNTAQSALNDAEDALKEDKDNEEKQQAVKTATANRDKAKTAVETAEGENKTAEENLTTAKNNCSVVSEGLYGFDAIEKALSEAESAKEQAKTARENAEKAVESAKKAVENAEQQVKNAHDNYDQEKNYSSLTNKQQNVEDSATKLEQTARTPDSLKDLQDTLDECTLKATMDGTITGLNATVGSVCSGTVATIQNTSALVVEVTIPASNVSKLSTGMKCRITSDATGDTEIEGTLTQIDPVANEQGSFGAKVTVNGEDSGLLIGISAKVEIVINEKEGVFSVPRDAVGTAEDGSSYVLRKTGGEGVDMTFEQVTVTTGDNNDYYVEIEGDDLSEGDVIRSSADLTQGIETGTDGDSSNMMMDGVYLDDGSAMEAPGGDMGGGPGGGPGGM